MAVDLHTHSTASDGSLTPDEVVAAAASRGLKAVALTDHDTIEGMAEARRAADHYGIELIPGTELSLDWDSGGMHLIVLFLDPGEGPLQDRLAGLQRGREGRNKAIVNKLADLGMDIDLEEVGQLAGGGSVGRPHIAAVMVRKGHVPDIPTAFDLWLGAGRPAYFPRPRLGPEEAIRLSRESGAVPVLAHPHTLRIYSGSEMADVLGRLLEAGLIGLEAVYSAYQRHEREGYIHLARRFGLLPSGGSDFHGTFKPGLDIGVGYGDLAVPDHVLSELRDRAGR